LDGCFDNIGTFFLLLHSTHCFYGGVLAEHLDAPSLSDGWSGGAEDEEKNREKNDDAAAAPEEGEGVGDDSEERGDDKDQGDQGGAASLTLGRTTRTHR
jgi:hypothetical protein